MTNVVAYNYTEQITAVKNYCTGQEMVNFVLFVFLNISAEILHCLFF